MSKKFDDVIRHQGTGDPVIARTISHVARVSVVEMPMTALEVLMASFIHVLAEELAFTQAEVAKLKGQGDA